MENAERPASSRPRIRTEGAADRLEREFPAAELTAAAARERVPHNSLEKLYKIF